MSTVTLRRAIIVATTALGALACEDTPEEPTPAAPSRCTGAVQLSVTRSGATPVFAWTPTCEADRLLVRATVGGTWSVTGNVGVGFTGPVQYPHAPAGGFAVGTLIAEGGFVPGERYTAVLTVRRWPSAVEDTVAMVPFTY